MGCSKYYRMGTPPPPQVWTDTQSENITSRHPSDAGGNYVMYYSKQVVPLVIYIGAVLGLLYYLGITQLILTKFGWLMSKNISYNCCRIC